MVFQTGDPWPQLIVASPSSQEVNLAHQTRAGRTTLYAFVPFEAVDRFRSDLQDRIVGMDAAVFAFNIISVAQPEGADGELGSIEQFFFGEPIAEKVIGATQGLALVDRGGRLRHVAPLGDLAATIEMARKLEAACASQFAPVLVLEEVLSGELCERLIAYWEKEPKLTDAVAAQQAGNKAANPDFKRRTDVVLRDTALSGDIGACFQRRIIPEIYKVMRVKIVESEMFRIGCYEASNLGGFRRHRDNTTRHTSHRAFAVSLNLNEPTYEGGQVIFPEFGDRQYRPGRGGAVVFSCGLLHEALPVRAGRRFGMFTFLIDEVGLKRIQQNKKAKKAG